MATIPARRRIAERTEPQRRVKRRESRLKRRLLVLLILIGAVVACLPMLVANSPLRNSLLQAGLPPGPWSISSQQASFGWFTGQQLHGVVLNNAAGQPLVSIESVVVQRSLVDIVSSQADLGRIQLVRPVVYVATDAAGRCELEKLLNAFRAQPSSGSTPTLSLEIVEGEVRGLDVPTGQQWRVADASLKLQLAESMAGEGSASVQVAGENQTGRLSFKLQPGATAGQRLELLAEGLPLAPGKFWASRQLPGAEMRGAISADGAIEWSTGVIAVDMRLLGEQLELTADALAGDSIRCERLEVSNKLQLNDEAMIIDQLALNGGWIELFAQGTAARGDLGIGNLASLSQNTFSANGRVSLARLVAMLPHALHVQEGVRLDTGQLEFAVGVDGNHAAASLTATVSVRDVLGSRDGRAIRWEQPVEFVAALAPENETVSLRNLSFASAFAKASFETVDNQTSGSFQFDLEQLAAQLGQIVDLAPWQLRGMGEGNLQFLRQADANFDANAELALTEFSLAENGQAVWEEPQLDLHALAAGRIFDMRLAEVVSGSLTLNGTHDRWKLQLAEPVELAGESQLWRLKLAGQGPLAAWRVRLQPWLAGLPAQLSGNTELTARIQIEPQAVHVVESECRIDALRVESESLSLNEPRIELRGDCRWDAATRTLVSSDFQLGGSTISFRARNLQAQFAEGGAPAASGTLAYRADLERLASIFHLVGAPNSTWPRGAVDGQVQLTSDAQLISADITLRGDQVQLLRQPANSHPLAARLETVWNEPHVDARGKVVYRWADDRLAVENFQAQGQTIGVGAAAVVDRLQTDQLLQLTASVNYDPNQLAQLVSAYTGPDIQLRPMQQAKFNVRGSLGDLKSLDRWQGGAEAGWTSAALYGLPVGKVQLRAELAAGRLTFAPLDVAVGEGRLRLSPRAEYVAGRPMLFLPAGPLLTNMAISQQVSENMLKYIAPALAGATRTEGLFSVDLADSQIPLDHPKTGVTGGRLTVHSLRIAPGPMILQLAAIVKQVEALAKKQPLATLTSTGTSTKAITMADQTVDFRVENGRVFHRNFEFLVDGAPVRTSGSVGFDETLALVVEIPVQDKWIAKEASLAFLSGQTIQLPVHGTFSSPQIDQRAVADLSRQLLQGAAQQTITNELNKQLEKLLRGK